MTETELPALPLFDRRRTRRAVVRGLLRTAFIVLVALFLLSLLAQLLGNRVMNGFDRADAMSRLGVTGYRVGHPGLSTDERSLVVGAFHVTSTLSGEMPDGLPVEVPLKMNIFGTLDRPPSLLDPLDRTLLGPGLDAAGARTFLRQLPSGVRADAVVQLARPMHSADVYSLAGIPGFSTLLYSQVFGPSVDFLARPVSWRPGYSTRFPESEQSFLEWAESLKSSDDDNLRTFGLPMSQELQRLAREDLVRAVWVRNQTPAQLEALLASPAVRSFTPSAVRFALPAQQEVH